MAEWEEFEQLLAKIYREASPNATVTHNRRIKDKRGRPRQFDIVIETTVGLQKLIIAVECKKYTRRVGIEKVDAFVTKLRDCRINQGVMVSRVGFDAGARSQAEEHGIALLTYREAEQADWHTIASPTSWFNLLRWDLALGPVLALCSDGSQVKIRSGAELYTGDGTSQGKVDEILDQFDTYLQSSPPPGIVVSDYLIDPPLHVMVRGELREFRVLRVQVSSRVFEYAINAPLASGHVLEQASGGEMFYRELSTEPFKVEQIIAAQSGRELSTDEFEERQAQEGYTIFEQAPEGARMRISMRTIPQ